MRLTTCCAMQSKPCQEETREALVLARRSAARRDRLHPRSAALAACDDTHISEAACNMDTTEVLPRKPLKWLCWHTRVAAVILGFLAIASPAHADTTSGRLAYERGDYQRAMEEWQAAADHNDPE